MRKEEILKFIAAFENSEFFFQLNNSAKMRCVSFFNLKMELQDEAKNGIVKKKKMTAHGWASTL